MKQPEGRVSVSLKALYECEWKTYEAALVAVKRLEDEQARQALRAVAAHANEALDELLTLASQRTIRLAAPVDVACELALRILQALADRAAERRIDRDVGIDGLEEQFARGMSQARLLRSVATEEGEGELAGYVDRWHRARSSLAASATAEIRRIRSKRSTTTVDRVRTTT